MRGLEIKTETVTAKPKVQTMYTTKKEAISKIISLIIITSSPIGLISDKGCSSVKESGIADVTNICCGIKVPLIVKIFASTLPSIRISDTNMPTDDNQSKVFQPLLKYSLKFQFLSSNNPISYAPKQSTCIIRKYANDNTSTITFSSFFVW